MHLDPFPEAAVGAMMLDPSRYGRNPVAPPTLAGTGVFLCGGQSNGANSVNATYTPTNASSIYQINIYDGGYYLAVDPLMGVSGATVTNGNHFLRVADKLITAGHYSRVILVPYAVNGYAIEQWIPGGVCHHRIGVVAERVRQAGLTPDADLWIHGEADGSLGTSRTLYRTRLTTLCAEKRAAGIDCPILISVTSRISGATYSDITDAQGDVFNDAAILDVYPGPLTDNLTGRYDTTHFDAADANTAADRWVTAIEAALGL